MTDTQSGARFAGEWWLPGNPNHRAHGTLKVEERRAELEMAEPLSREWYGDLAHVADGVIQLVPAVHGNAAGTDFTLLGCDLPVELVGSPIITLDADAILQGAHVEHADDDRFAGACLRIQNLNAYAGNSGLRVSANGALITPVRDPVHATAIEGLAVSLEWTFSRSIGTTASGRTITVTEVVQFDVRSAEPISVNRVRRVARRLEDLVTFMTGTGSVTTFRALLGPAMPAADAAAAGSRTISYLNETSTFAPVTAAVPAALVLRLDEIEWAQLVSRWFALYDDFRPILGTLVGQRYLPTQFIENRALNLVIAAEQTSRALELKDTFLTDGQLSKVRKTIRAALEAAEGIRGIIGPNLEAFLEQLHNRVTLDARLRGIVAFVGVPAENMLGGPEGVAWWVVAARRSRNDLGHTGHTQKYTVSALSAIARATEALLELVIAKKLGADDALLTKIVERRHRRIAALVSAHLQPTDTAAKGT